MPQDEKIWEKRFEEFSSNLQVGRILSDVDFPGLKTEDNFQLFFKVLGDKQRRRLPELAEVLGFSARKTKIILGTLQNASPDGQSWRTHSDPNDIRRRGGNEFDR